MSAIRKEILEYIDAIPDSKLEALKPILTLLANDTLTIETDLTEDEKRNHSERTKEIRTGRVCSS